MGAIASLALSKAGLPVLQGLLGSKSRARLLMIFVARPTEEFYAQRLTGMIGLAESSVRYELRRLERLDLLVARREGREKFYRINSRHPLFPELKQIVYKTAGLGDALRQAIGKVPGVNAAFVYGSVAKGTERATSDLDLFLLGTPDRANLSTVLRDAEDRLGREINLTIMRIDEWHRRRKVGEGFIHDVVRSPKIFLIGDEQALR